MTNTLSDCPLCQKSKFQPYLQTVDFAFSKENFSLVQCENCQLIITENAPDESKIGKYYQFEDYISHSDTNEGLVNKLYHSARNYMLSQKRKHAEKHVNSLPNNCWMLAAVPVIFKSYAAIWLECKRVEQDEGARKFVKSQFDIKVMHQANLFSYEKNTISLITLWHVLEHLYDPLKYVNQFHNLLINNGILIIAVPNPTSYDAKKYKQNWAAYDVPRHLWHFPPNTLINSLESNGFKLQELKKMPLDAFYVSLLSEKYQQKSVPLVADFLADYFLI